MGNQRKGHGAQGHGIRTANGLGVGPILTWWRIGQIVAGGLGPLAFVWTCVDACTGAEMAMVQLYRYFRCQRVSRRRRLHRLQYPLVWGAQRASPVPAGVVDGCTRGGNRCSISVENDACNVSDRVSDTWWMDAWRCADANDVDTRERVVELDRHSHRISLVKRNRKNH